jgi:tight adherence protein C
MDFILDTFGDSNATMVGVLVFLAATTLTFCVMVLIRAQGSIRRRAAGISTAGSVQEGGGSRSLRGSSMKAAERVIEYTQKHYASGNDEQLKVLRRRMMQAGIYNPRAVAYFFLGRTLLAVALAALVFMFAPTEEGSPVAWLLAVMGGIVGYIGPSFYIDKRIKARKEEHQVGFPDFMDLLVVCADAGLSMEASLDRVGRELATSYPSLTANIHMTNLEIRAGRTMSAALTQLGDRLGIEEARSFATLIQQSEELGSSITDALRVYSDDMRHKRLSRAEEKAYSLPARLSVPMMICIFPVLFVVILLPVVVRLYVGNWN